MSNPDPKASPPKSITETLAELAALAPTMKKLQAAAESTPPSISDWAVAASECLKRTVDFVVTYNRREGKRGGENYQFQIISHACRISETEVIAAKEALDAAREVADFRRGKVMIVCEMQWFDFEADAVDSTSGLVLCRSLKRDEQSWNEFQKMWEERGLDKPTQTKFTRVKSTLMPFTGNEIGYVHEGEAENIWPGQSQLRPKQFDTTYISHFQKPADLEFAFKSFVTGVLASRILYPGSPVFDRTGTLLGLIAKTDRFEGDAGRRAIVKSLLAHPWFKEKS